MPSISFQVTIKIIVAHINLGYLVKTLRDSVIVNVAGEKKQSRLSWREISGQGNTPTTPIPTHHL